MSIKAYRPTTPAQRKKTTQDFDQITTRKPMKSLLASKKQMAGKNNAGRIPYVIVAAASNAITVS